MYVCFLVCAANGRNKSQKLLSPRVVRVRCVEQRVSCRKMSRADDEHARRRVECRLLYDVGGAVDVSD